VLGPFPDVSKPVALTVPAVPTLTADNIPVDIAVTALEPETLRIAES
jgi:hypothetical protein